MSRMSKQQAIDILQDFDSNYTVSVETIKFPELSDGNRYRAVAQANEKNEEGLLAVKTIFFKTGFDLVHAAHFVVDFKGISFDDLLHADLDEYWHSHEQEQRSEYFKQRATAAKEDK